MSNTVICFINFYQLSAWRARFCTSAINNLFLACFITAVYWVLAMGHINRKPRSDGTAGKFRLSQLYCSSRREWSARFSVICPLPKWLLTIAKTPWPPSTITANNSLLASAASGGKGVRGKRRLFAPFYLSSLKYVTPNPLGGCAFLLSRILVTISTATVTT